MAITFIIISSLIGSLIATPIVLVSGKKIAKIENINFLNTYLVCFFGTLLVYFFWYSLGADNEIFKRALKLKIDGLLLALGIHIAISFISLTLLGKFIWKSNWLKTMKAHLVWLLVNVITIATLLFVFHKELKKLF